MNGQNVLKPFNNPNVFIHLDVSFEACQTDGLNIFRIDAHWSGES